MNDKINMPLELLEKVVMNHKINMPLELLEVVNRFDFMYWGEKGQKLK